MSRRSVFRHRAVPGVMAFVAATTLLGALAPAASAAPPNAVFTGTVTGADGLPLRGVDVTAAHIQYVGGFPLPSVDVYGEAVTAADGTYRMTVRPTDDSLTVQFGAARAVGGTSPTGYADQCYAGSYTCNYGADRTFTAVAGQVTRGVDGRLPRAAELRGRAVDATGRSVSGLAVSLRENRSCVPFDDAPWYASTTTDRNGNYVFTRLPAFSVAACLGNGSSGVGGPARDGYIARLLPVTTTAGRVSHPVTTLREAGGVSGTVVGTDGAPVQGATVQVYGPTSVSIAVSASDGTFRVARVTPGSDVWCVEAPMYAGTCDDDPLPSVTVRSGTTTSLGTITLRRLS